MRVVGAGAAGARRGPVEIDEVGVRVGVGVVFGGRLDEERRAGRGGTVGQACGGHVRGEEEIHHKRARGVKEVARSGRFILTIYPFAVGARMYEGGPCNYVRTTT